MELIQFSCNDRLILKLGGTVEIKPPAFFFAIFSAERKIMQLKLKRKRINIISFMLSLLAGLTILVMPTVNAVGLNDVPKVMLKCINESVTSIYMQVLFNDEDTFGDTALIEGGEDNILLESRRTYDPFNGGSGKSIFHYVVLDNESSNPVYAVLVGIKGIAIAIAFISFFTRGALEIYNTQADPYKIVLEMLIKLGICVGLITFSDKIVVLVIRFALFFVTLILKSLTMTSQTTEELTIEALVGTGRWKILELFDDLAMIIILSPAFILSLLSKLFSWLTAFSILIDIGIRKAMIPIGIIEFYTEKFSSPGIRYIKKLMAGILRLGIAAIICGLLQFILGMMTLETGAETGESLSFATRLVRGMMYALATVILNFTAVSFIAKSGAYANDAMEL